jgi:peroxiredoxin
MQAKDVSRLIGQPAPDFILPSVEGTKLSLAALRGRFVVLDFIRHLG